MNEVRLTQLSEPVVTRTASSQDAGREQGLPTSGKELPTNNVEQSVANQSLEPENATALQIEQAVSEINEYVQTVQRDLHFSVDEDTGTTVIRVRDKESGELIRQIPEDIFLNLAQELKDTQTLHLFDAHG